MALIRTYEDEGDTMELVEIWHIVDEKWVHLTQITNLNTKYVKLFTDGELVHECYVGDDGTFAFDCE